MTLHIINEVFGLHNLFADDGLKARYPVHVSFERGRVMLVRAASPQQTTLIDRQYIHAFTRSSRSRMSKYIRTSDSTYRALATLTYPAWYKVTGLEASVHLKRLWQRWKRLKEKTGGFSQELPSWFWFKEFQSNGQIHIHFFTTHFIPKAWLSKAWYEITGKLGLSHLLAGTNIKRIKGGRAAIGSYSLKYARKESQKARPAGFESVGRYWGVLGNRHKTAVSLTYTLDNGAYNHWVSLMIGQVQKIFDVKPRTNAALWEVKEWEIPSQAGNIKGKTIEIKSEWLAGRMEKRIREIMQYAEGHCVPSKPIEQTVFHAMRCRQSSLELSRRYRKLQERDYRMRCKTARIRGDCDTNERSGDTGGRSEEARRDKKFRLETWAVNKYGQ